MDPFSAERPKPTHTHKRTQFRNGYGLVPESFEITSGPKGFDANLRVPATISNRFAHHDMRFDDPCINGNIYPSHLAYRRKNGDFYTLPPKIPEDEKTTPQLRIMPQTALYDNMCLRYYGYYVERLFGGDVSYQDYGYRVRQVELVYHMEDDTISVFEPYLENSGLPQGLTCPRRPYYWPGPDLTRKKAYFWTDFHLGCDYHIAHFKIHLYDADDFTKQYWKDQASLDELGKPEPAHTDPVWVKAQANRQAWKPHDVKVKLEESTTMHQKKYHWEEPIDAKLVFIGIVDDTLFPMARCRPVVVEYYLVDETIRVMEFRIDNDAHQFGSNLNTAVRRGRIPRGLGHQNSQFALGPFHKPYLTEFYNPTDLFVGNTVWFYGQKILLVECNEWTRKWIKDKLNVDQPPDMEWRDQYRRRPLVSSRTLCIPKHIGIGTHDDTLKSVLEIEPQMRPKDELPQLCNSDDIIKYTAKLYSRHPDAHIPTYVILYYVADDTMEVFEHTVHGDASYGKKFMRRQKFRIPELQKDPFERTVNPGPYYDFRHVLPGNLLNLNGQRLLLIAPDEHISNVIKRHPKLYNAEELALIDEAIKDQRGRPPPFISPPTKDQLMVLAPVRADKLMQRFKYWILHNPKYLMLLLSEDDDDNLNVITADLLLNVSTSGGLDCDMYSVTEMYERARMALGKDEGEKLYSDEFVRFIVQSSKGLKESEAKLNPRPPTPKLKFRLDLHT